MQYSPVNIFALLALLLLPTLTSLVSASPTAKREILMPDHAVYPTWTFTARDGTEHTVEGTITDYLTKREAIDPTFKRNPTPVINETYLAEKLAARAELEPRNIQSPPLCIPIANWGWGYCEYLDALAAQNELIANNVRPNVPCCQWGKCVMIYCGGTASVWICNDNPYWINPATAYMAQYVGDIGHYCQTDIISTPGGGLNWNTGGQEFDTDHYNVIARDNAGFC